MDSVPAGWGESSVRRVCGRTMLFGEYLALDVYSKKTFFRVIAHLFRDLLARLQVVVAGSWKPQGVVWGIDKVKHLC